MNTDHTQPDAAEVRAAFGLPDNARIVLTVASMTEQKGHKHLLDAIPTVVAHEPDAHFVWVGEGPLEGELRGRAAQLGIDERRLVFAGRRDDIPHLLAAADLFVLPSLADELPIPLLEAMAAGCAIVCTAVRSTHKVIEDEVNGRLVAPANPAALATGIIEGLCHEESVRRWRKAARRKVQQLFSAARLGREMADVYETATSRRTRQKGATQRPLGAPAMPLGVLPQPPVLAGAGQNTAAYSAAAD